MPRVREFLHERLSSRAARRWYPGGSFGGLYSLIGAWFVWTGGGPLASALAVTALLLVVSGIYVFLPPLLWGTARGWIYLALLGYAAVICTLFPFIGPWTSWLFMYIACAAASCFPRVVDAAVGVAAAALGQFAVLTAAGLIADEWFIIALTVSIATMLRGISQLARTVGELRQAQSEVARLAVAEERARFTRDLHDVLGHSLTVVTVKSELAARLVDRDPQRAKTELADIERLGRGALADLRASIAGYREMNLDTELAAARVALAAAEVEATVPASGDTVVPPLRELFAWAVRESVTNVIRHAGAASCTIELRADAVTIADDGVGMGACVDAENTDAAGGIRSGSGLAGLSARAAAVGAVLLVAAREPHGTVVTVTGAAAR
ncbi:sensor histidine kinase [Gryllotalpicola koreensis]|uniref:Signal transduction histidine kinase subgroup 3 dimerisation and phosphoacceptor domain-containing protein n=1 Tax=Gryllotalpicola koreensis TaxID=993086 RepID=A0ABP7ZPN7_9MICO